MLDEPTVELVPETLQQLDLPGDGKIWPDAMQGLLEQLADRSGMRQEVSGVGADPALLKAFGRRLGAVVAQGAAYHWMGKPVAKPSQTQRAALM